MDIERVDRGKERGMNGGKKEEHGGVKWRVKMGKMGERQKYRAEGYQYPLFTRIFR